MDLDEFFRTRPCLEELTGFRAQAIKDGHWEYDDQAKWLTHQDRLKRGLEMPVPTRLERSWEYRQRRSAKKRKIHV